MTGGYYQLGKVFMEQSKIVEAGAVFDKVVTIWKSAVKAGEEIGNFIISLFLLDEAQQVEAIQMLSHLLDFRTAHPKGEFGIAEIQFALANIYNLGNQQDKAKELSTKALEGINYYFIFSLRKSTWT